MRNFSLLIISFLLLAACKTVQLPDSPATGGTTVNPQDVAKMQTFVGTWEDTRDVYPNGQVKNYAAKESTFIITAKDANSNEGMLENYTFGNKVASTAVRVMNGQFEAYVNSSWVPDLQLTVTGSEIVNVADSPDVTGQVATSYARRVQ